MKIIKEEEVIEGSAIQMEDGHKFQCTQNLFFIPSHPWGVGSSVDSTIANDTVSNKVLMTRSTEELNRLNTNLENIQGELPQLEKLTEAVADLGTMIAPLLGWHVVDKERQKQEKTTGRP